jgi:hypothetical protein
MPHIHSTAAAPPAAPAPAGNAHAAVEAKTSALHPIAIRTRSAAHSPIDAEQTPLLGADTAEAASALRQETRPSATVAAVARSAYAKWDRTAGLRLGISADRIGVQSDAGVADDARNLVAGLLVQLQADLRQTALNCEIRNSEDSARAGSPSTLTLHVSAPQLNTQTLRALAKAVERRRLQYQLGSGEQEGGPSDVVLYRVLSCSGMRELVSVDPKKLRAWFQQSYERGERLVCGVSAPSPDPS